MPAFKDISNQIFGRLTAKECVGKDRFGISLWNCHCVCGKESTVRLRSLVSGATKSCGCYNQAVRSNRMIGNQYAATHELTHHPLYRTWATMRQRCTNPNNSKYHLYGGRGISVDPSWESFPTFLSDMGERPEGMTLDRKDNNSGYSKENCRWATASEQNKNRRPSMTLQDYSMNSEKICKNCEYWAREWNNTCDLIHWNDEPKENEAGIRVKMPYSSNLGIRFITGPVFGCNRFKTRVENT